MENLNDVNEALTKVSENGDLEEVKAFICHHLQCTDVRHAERAGADVNAVDEFDETALMKASKGEHLEVMKVLICHHLQCTDVRHAGRVL